MEAAPPADPPAAPPPPADPLVEDVVLPPAATASTPVTPVPSRPPSRPAAPPAVTNVWEPPTPLLFRDIPGINGAPPSRCHFPHELSDRDYLQRLLELIPHGLWPTIQVSEWHRHPHISIHGHSRGCVFSSNNHLLHL
jgi:hypothetical protein